LCLWTQLNALTSIGVILGCYCQLYYNANYSFSVNYMEPKKTWKSTFSYQYFLSIIILINIPNKSNLVCVLILNRRFSLLAATCNYRRYDASVGCQTSCLPRGKCTLYTTSFFDVIWRQFHPVLFYRPSTEEYVHETVVFTATLQNISNIASVRRHDISKWSPWEPWSSAWIVVL